MILPLGLRRYSPDDHPSTQSVYYHSPLVIPPLPHAAAVSHFSLLQTFSVSVSPTGPEPKLPHLTPSPAASSNRTPAEAAPPRPPAPRRTRFLLGSGLGSWCWIRSSAGDFGHVWGGRSEALERYEGGLSLVVPGDSLAPR